MFSWKKKLGKKIIHAIDEVAWCWGVMMLLLSLKMGHPNDGDGNCHMRLNLHSLDTNWFLDEMVKV